MNRNVTKTDPFCIAEGILLWIGNQDVELGEAVHVYDSKLANEFSFSSTETVRFVLKYLESEKLIEIKYSAGVLKTPPSSFINLTFNGWKKIDELRRGKSNSRRVFMAMKFGIEELDSIVETIFKPCVKRTGFELFRLDDDPKAGLIDDKLRVAIRTSHFLIADLTHDNPGAYWEAGFAEGLGKLVIYVCEKSKFENDKTHFDTNHHLTILWDKNNPKEAEERLVNTIRATFPDLAIIED